ncbi:MAG: hypothetical protein LBC41_13625, partial [Clostridiales bacterium]|nr:hypothetical protein [Clostridiales bacterium]
LYRQFTLLALLYKQQICQQTYYSKTLSGYACNLRFLVNIPKFRIGAGKVLANASTPDFYGTSDIILGYALTKRTG